MLKFLVDEQLPQALVRWLVARGHQARHVEDLGMSSTGDAEIATFAKSEDLIVVSKDADFLWLHAQDPKSFGLILLRLGNCTNSELLRRLDVIWPEIVLAFSAGDRCMVIGP